MFVLGKVYKRINLHEKYGGQRQGGISTPSEHNFLMLFSGEIGQKYGYRDGWSEEGLFFYTGEGQQGDMSFIRGNLAIREHAKNGKDIHLFNHVHPGYVRYIGQMICTGFHKRRDKDVNEEERSMIVFELIPIDTFDKELPIGEKEKYEDMWNEPISTLRKRALASSTGSRGPSERRALIHHRSHAIRIYVLRRANGVCEACKENAPFRTSSGRLYLEPHHIRRLSDGGPEDIRYIIAVCPNCHRRAHFSKDKLEFNKRLALIVNYIEMKRGD